MMSKPTGTTAKYHGLINLGSTCYLNSVLQVLFMTKEFRDAVIRTKGENPGADFIDRHLKHLFTELQKRKTKTRRILKALSINNVNELQDAAEYFEKILSKTSPDAAKDCVCLSLQIFHGQMTHRTTCSECGTQNDTDGPFWHLPLELVDSSSGNYSVDGGIDSFLRASEFSGDNQMYCDTCEAKVNATSSYVIKDHPDVLILLLKRFDYDQHHKSFIKINCCVEIPHTLKILENQTYEFYAAVDHVGDLRGGHYAATIKLQDDDRWYNFNDAKVTPVECNPFPHDASILRSDNAYLLYYRKTETNPGEPKEVCTSEEQSATSGMHAQKNENTTSVWNMADKVHQNTGVHQSSKGSDVPAPCGRQQSRIKQTDEKQKGEESAERRAQHRDSKELCRDCKQSGGGNGAEEDRMHTGGKAKRRRGCESDKDGGQEDGVATNEIKEINDQKFTERSGSRSENRKKYRSNPKSDENRHVDQRKLDDEQEKGRKLVVTRSHSDVMHQERRRSQQKPSGTSKTLIHASNRSNETQETGKHVADFQRETTERRTENCQTRISSRNLQSKHSRLVLAEEPREVPSEDKCISKTTDATKPSSPRTAGVDPREQSLSTQEDTGKGSRKTRMKRKTDHAGRFKGLELQASQGNNVKKSNCFTWCVFGRKGQDSD
nr:ubiquitin carboxyl-terminal hydrolase 17-like protein B isoform X1 [Nothobranchius furzeri]